MVAAAVLMIPIIVAEFGGAVSLPISRKFPFRSTGEKNGSVTSELSCMPYKNPSLLFRPKALNCRSIGLPDGCTFPALSIRKIWKGDAVLLIPGLVTATDTPGQLSKATNGFLPTQEAI